jgi:hypothetical protein
VFSFDVGVECGIGEVAGSPLASAYKLPSFLVFPGLAYFFFLDIAFLLNFDIILDHVVVDHAPLFVDLCLTHGLVAETLADRDEFLGGFGLFGLVGCAEFSTLAAWVKT